MDGFKDFAALARAARTCRRFEEGSPLSMADLEWLAECARLTPCAGNRQILRLILVGGKRVADVLPHVKWAAALKDWDGPAEGERPTGFIVVARPKEASGHLVWADTGIMVQTLQLAASSRGWGCCIFASFDPAGCRSACSLPDDLEPALVLAFGVAREVRRVADVPRNGSLDYWRDADGTHHVPKRSLDELIIGRLS